MVKQIYSLCLASGERSDQDSPYAYGTADTHAERWNTAGREAHVATTCMSAMGDKHRGAYPENRIHGLPCRTSRPKVSYKVKQSKENPEEKQVIFENHHEPIIIDRTRRKACAGATKTAQTPNRYDEVGLFSGILFCADCGSVMYQQRYQTDKRRQDCYICVWQEAHP